MIRNKRIRVEAPEPRQPERGIYAEDGECVKCGDLIVGVDRPWCVRCSPYVRALVRDIQRRREAGEDL